MKNKTNELTQSDTERERKTAKKITACLMSILKFWRLCKKKKKPPPTKGPGFPKKT